MLTGDGRGLRHLKILDSWRSYTESEIKWKQTRGWSECLFYFIVLNSINERVNLPPQGKYFLMAGRNLYLGIKFMTNNNQSEKIQLLKKISISWKKLNQLNHAGC